MQVAKLTEQNQKLTDDVHSLKISDAVGSGDDTVGQRAEQNECIKNTPTRSWMKRILLSHHFQEINL